MMVKKPCQPVPQDVPIAITKPARLNRRLRKKLERERRMTSRTLQLDDLLRSRGVLSAFWQVKSHGGQLEQREQATHDRWQKVMEEIADKGSGESILLAFGTTYRTRTETIAYFKRAIPWFTHKKIRELFRGEKKRFKALQEKKENRRLRDLAATGRLYATGGFYKSAAKTIWKKHRKSLAIVLARQTHPRGIQIIWDAQWWNKVTSLTLLSYARRGKHVWGYPRYHCVFSLPEYAWEYRPDESSDEIFCIWTDDWIKELAFSRHRR